MSSQPGAHSPCRQRCRKRSIKFSNLAAATKKSITGQKRAQCAKIKIGNSPASLRVHTQMTDSTQSPTYLADPIHESILIQEHERLIIDSPMFQRLRKIRQLGNVFLLFPGALHTRFEHSIGVMHIAGQYFDALFRRIRSESNEVSKALDNVRRVVRLAGLLHDIGHGPFSHLYESFLSKRTARDLLRKDEDTKADLSIPKSWFETIENTKRQEWCERKLEHEHYSCAIISYIVKSLHESSEAPANYYYDGIDQDICSLLDETIPSTGRFDSWLSELATPKGGILAGANTESLKRCLHAIISSDFDADKLDYLQRDAYYCGIKSNAIDLHYIFNSIQIAKDGKNICYVSIPQKLIPSFEHVLIIRRQMYARVYMHRVNSTFDHLLLQALNNVFQEKQDSTFVNNAIDFLSRTDDWLIEQAFIVASTAAKKIDKNLDGLTKAELASLMYFTRTMPVKVLEKIIPLVEKSEHEILFKAHCEATGVKDPEIVSPKIKELTNTLRDGIKSDRPEDGIFRVESSLKKVEPTNIGYKSDVLHSSLWRDATVRLIAFQSLKESAMDSKRNLTRRVRLRFG